ncbi:TPA: DUF1642 domain-containing protein [Streptococcus suis]
MNKQEAIELLQDMAEESFKIAKIHAVYIDSIVEVVNEIDEPQKPVVPKFVAEWIEWCKTNNATLLGAISPIDELGSAICNDKRVKSLAASRWAQRNQDTFARAWIDGYTVEQLEGTDE